MQYSEWANSVRDHDVMPRDGLEQTIEVNSGPPATPWEAIRKAWYEGQQSVDFSAARGLMAESLAQDEGLRLAYEANVAMMLLDRHGIEDKATRDAITMDVLHLIFRHPEPCPA